MIKKTTRTKPAVYPSLQGTSVRYDKRNNGPSVPIRSHAIDHCTLCALG